MKIGNKQNKGQKGEKLKLGCDWLSARCYKLERRARDTKYESSNNGVINEEKKLSEMGGIFKGYVKKLLSRKVNFKIFAPLTHLYSENLSHHFDTGSFLYRTVAVYLL